MQGLLFVQGAFTLRQDWIAGTLCVNRDRPETRCDGLFVLKERMASHHHGPEEGAGDTAVLTVALSTSPLVAEAPVLPAPEGAPASAPRPAPLVGPGRDALAEVFRLPRRG